MRTSLVVPDPISSPDLYTSWNLLGFWTMKRPGCTLIWFRLEILGKRHSEEVFLYVGFIEQPIIRKRFRSGGRG